MQIALLGLPQAGKRTLFTLLTGRRVPESRKPGEVLEGIAQIRDPRIDRLAEICKPERKVYAENRFGLCPDVVAGAGAKEWLDTARRSDLLCLVVRAFTSDQIAHPAGSVDPERDARDILAELMLADMELVEKRLTRIGKEKRAGQTAAQQLEEHVLQKCMRALEADKRLVDAGLEEHEMAPVRSLGFLTLVPVLITYNVDEARVVEPAGPGILAVSAKIEQEIMGMQDAAERQEYLSSLGLASSGVDRMNAAAYDAMGMMSFYTIGEDEVRAWTIRKGSAAPTAAGKVHKDIERGFIRVEIIKYDDLIEAGSEQAVKQHGKVKTKGRDYTIEDGDICHFLFNV